MTSPPAQPPGTPSTECSFCGSKNWHRRKMEVVKRGEMVGSIYHVEEVILEQEITTWECANRDCRRMMQTERSLGWKTK